MKKFFISVFAVFYLGLSCGFAYDMHFCMGKFSSVELFPTGNNTCSKCGMKNREGCCTSKLTVVKITDSQQASTTSSGIYPLFTVMVNGYAYTHSRPVELSLPTIYSDTSPPAITGSFRCILNSIFTI